ncbi:hypothetical protein FHX36_003023 [Modestobacter versicolor]|uniref:Uncharacterized protein n=1 Tax=Modestobacter versicolor TaxID=429133 RepID=A0A839Y241_9ACTN|nr:hypothetical protein [Modestobacter versicolor]
MRPLPGLLAGRAGCRGRAGQLPHRHRPVVVRGSVPEVDVRVPEVGGAARPVRRLGQRRQRQPVDRRRDGPVPAQPVAVRATAPARGLPGETAQPGDQRPHRCGQPRRRGSQPGPRAQQVDGEVGGELDRRLELVVDGTGGGPAGRRDGRGRDGGPGGEGRRGGPVRTAAEPVDPQRCRPPGQVGAVRAGTPGGDPAAQLLPAGGRGRRGDGGRRAGRGPGRHAARVDAQHPDGQAERQAASQVTGGVRLGRLHRSGAEQAGAAGGAGGGHVGTPDRCRLDRHVPPSREVVAAAGEGTAGKEKPRDDGASGPVPGTLRSGRVTEPLPDPLAAVDDPPVTPVTCRHPPGKPQVAPLVRGR